MKIQNMLYFMIARVNTGCTIIKIKGSDAERNNNKCRQSTRLNKLQPQRRNDNNFKFLKKDLSLIIIL